jgi:hypothetical protein
MRLAWIAILCVTGTSVCVAAEATVTNADTLVLNGTPYRLSSLNARQVMRFRRIGRTYLSNRPVGPYSSAMSARAIEIMPLSPIALCVRHASSVHGGK